MTWFMLGAFFLLMLLGTPVAFALAVTAVLTMVQMDMLSMLRIVPMKFYSGIDLFSLMAMPFFILAGDIMNRIRITDRLVDLANVLVGWLRGGLAHVNIVVSVFFAGLTGAAVADTAALGKMLIPAMERQGYRRPFAAAVTAASSIIGPIIPPSIIMVIYGSLMNVSIAGLFAAGVVPGLLVGVGLMAYVALSARRLDLPKVGRPASAADVGRAFKRALLPLMMPVIILGGILGGVFTPTEAAAVAVVFALFVGFFVYRNLSLSDMPAVLTDMVRASGSVFIILSAAAILGWLLAMEQVPQAIGEGLLGISENPLVFLLIVNILLLVIGMVMDMTAVLIILGPILHPIAMDLGIDPLHFGIVMIVNINLALMTPPLGACLFVTCTVSKVSLEVLSREILPFLLVVIGVLGLVTSVPALSTTLPRLLGFG
ncbi:TRAP-type C4-dicarboxylate transport system, large permease component [Caenispirillum salinarum AK4]|uniref:TRAP transporter large permease protein n=1 Tax=Caenispirillum salinarum AK4 TaxID=1238182 RepID=K9GUW0_9PROT|nr:TRAP transporter large permease [Caenispirillum salinarum]EKV29760.1 TRAP-type C4-dicarboxylate transport system, large permease component [Caenispirillum salinarum AK4]